MKIAIIDFETAGINPDCVVLSAGCIVGDLNDDLNFDELVSRGLYLKFDVEQQRDSGRSITQSTIKWWKTQSERAKHVLRKSQDDEPISVLIPKVIEYLEECGFNFKSDKIYARGTDFDFPIWRNIFNTYHKDHKTFPFWSVRDIRTFIDTAIIMNGYNGNFLNGTVPNYKKHENTILHHALHDCCNDLIQMKTAMETKF